MEELNMLIQKEVDKVTRYKKAVEKVNEEIKDVKAIIKIEVPEWQIGKEVSVYFPDTMCIKATVERSDDDA